MFKKTIAAAALAVLVGAPLAHAQSSATTTAPAGSNRGGEVRGLDRANQAAGTQGQQGRDRAAQAQERATEKKEMKSERKVEKKETKTERKATTQNKSAGKKGS